MKQNTEQKYGGNISMKNGHINWSYNIACTCKPSNIYTSGEQILTDVIHARRLMVCRKRASTKYDCRGWLDYFSNYLGRKEPTRDEVMICRVRRPTANKSKCLILSRLSRGEGGSYVVHDCIRFCKEDDIFGKKASSQSWNSTAEAIVKGTFDARYESPRRGRAQNNSFE